MLGGLEFVAGAALVGGGIGAWTSTDRDSQEQRAACALYARVFKEDFLGAAPEVATSARSSAPSGLNAQAAACIKILESYQDQRRPFMGMLRTSKSSASDTRTRIVEELKMWCLTQSGDDLSCEGVSLRLEYCRQLLLLQTLFTSTSKPSFLETVAEVCKQLERMVHQAMSRRRNGVDSLGRLLHAGRDLIRESVPVLIYSLLDEASLPERAAGARPSAFAAAAPFVCGAEHMMTPPPLGLDVFDGLSGGDDPLAPRGQPTRARTLLQSLLGSPHVRELGDGDPEGGASAGGPPPWASGLQFSSELESAKGEWEEEDIDRRVEDRVSGLRKEFRGRMHKGSRLDYLTMCKQVDKVAFFLQSLRPFHHCAVDVGDMALCALREPLVHAVRELEGALAELRLARKQVARAAKRGLQDQVLVGGARGDAELRWAQGLRHMQDASLDGKHKELEGHCSQVRAAVAQGREAELHGERARELRQAAARLQDADFVVRCSQRPPLGLTNGAPPLGLADSAPRGALAIAPRGAVAIEPPARRAP